MTPFETAYSEIAKLAEEFSANESHKLKYPDNEIDKLVYELYGLTEEEIKMVEEE